MKKELVIFLTFIISLIFFISGCVQEQYMLCPDNITRVIDLTNCPVEKPKCPETCDDNVSCTRDSCSASTGYKCVNTEIVPCDGNDICEEGEFLFSDDCPESCDDNDICTNDNFNYDAGVCYNEDIIPCCGNGECEKGETYVNCELDCEQRLDITVKRYEKTQRITDADLVGTRYVYLIVHFNINNLNIDIEESIGYKKQKGFYYDPFKFRLESGDGRLYDVEYDSDTLDGWLDYTIIPKGDSRGAVLMFIVPISESNLRLVAYDRYGSRLDVSDVS